jgi:tetratricopeptide (TPR) repeat protein
VLGQSFTPASLAALAGTAPEEIEPRLRGMVRRELLTLDANARSPERGQYSFVQALIREVAYNTLSKKDRRTKHLAAARWFESQGSDELAGALARHYLAAWHNSPEGPEADALAGQARLALRGAADRALDLYANAQALELLREALAVTDDPAERGEILTVMATTTQRIGQYQEAERLAREAIAILRTGTDQAAVCRAAIQVLRSYSNQLREQEYPELLAEFGDLLDVTDQRDALELRIRFASIIGAALAHEEAERMIEPAVAGTERLGDRGLILDCLNQLAAIVAERGRVVQALILLDGVARAAEPIGRADLVDRARANFAVWSMDNDPAASLAAYRSNMEQERRTGDRRSLINSVANAVELAIAAGDWDGPLAEAEDLLRDDLEASDWILMSEQLTIAAILRGEPAAAVLLDRARVLAGDSESFINLLDERLAFAAWVEGDAARAAHLWRHYAAWSFLNAPATLPRAARANLWAGDLDEARRDLAATIDTGLHGAVIEANVVTIQAGIVALEGRTAEARTLFRDALGRWRELRQEWLEALTCMDVVLLLGADDPDAPAAAERAREVFERLRAAPFLARLDAALAGGGGAAGGARRRSGARASTSSAASTESAPA